MDNAAEISNYAINIGLVIGILFLVLITLYVGHTYAKHIKRWPRELFLLCFAATGQTAAYCAMTIAFVLFLSTDCGMNENSAHTYFNVWRNIILVVMLFVGFTCDAIGIRKTLLTGTILLFLSHLFLPLSTNVVFMTIIGILPMTIGIAVMNPVVSVAIKRYTTPNTAALGFAFVPTVIGFGEALGVLIFGEIHSSVTENAVITIPIINAEISIYQIILMSASLFLLPGLIAVRYMRNGVEMHGDGRCTIGEEKIKQEGAILPAMVGGIKAAVKESIAIVKSVVRGRAFRYFMLAIALLVFVRFIFFHLHYTWPNYSIRVFGEGLKIGNTFVLNPVMITVLTPLIAALTRKFNSYKMIVVGTFISAFSVFIVSFPEGFFHPLMNTWFAHLIMDRWLEIPTTLQRPLFLSHVIFIFIFSIGEAIWAPRLMQFIVEIAPRGREASYFVFSNIPYFFGKLLLAPISSLLLATYIPKGQADYPMHQMFWVWVGVMAIISPFGLFLLRKHFLNGHRSDSEEAPKTTFEP